jgi:hypothetical protein
MKLRTEVVSAYGRKMVTLGHSIGPYSAREYDALAAHALMQAIDEAFSEWETYGAPTQRSIEHRADELMREWTGEVG